MQERSPFLPVKPSYCALRPVLGLLSVCIMKVLKHPIVFLKTVDPAAALYLLLVSEDGWFGPKTQLHPGLSSSRCAGGRSFHQLLHLRHRLPEVVSGPHHLPAHAAVVVQSSFLQRLRHVCRCGNTLKGMQQEFLLNSQYFWGLSYDLEHTSHTEYFILSISSYIIRISIRENVWLTQHYILYKSYTSFIKSSSVLEHSSLNARLSHSVHTG